MEIQDLVKDLVKDLEKELGLPLPSNFEFYDSVVQNSMIEYLRQLNTIEKKAYIIGKEHLGSSFNVIKSNGYITWKNKQK